tara:strand:+ start:2071 stop:2262 length:192 start_codon:yes stop_codon:yes gene_type:complete
MIVDGQRMTQLMCGINIKEQNNNNMTTIGLIMIFCVGFVSGMYTTTQIDKCIDKRIYRDDTKK